MNAIEIQVLEYNSGLQKKSIELRYKVLREPLGLLYTEEQLAAEKDEIHIAAIQKDEVVGILLLKKASDTTLKMRQVAIGFDHQKTGIGKMLVAFSEQYAVHNGFDSIELHARDVAKDFYLKLNYEITSDVFMEVGIPHYAMRKVLR